MADKKFYVVFRGHNPGVYDDWDEVKEQTIGFPGAIFKGFSTSEEATRAYRNFSGLEDRNELFRLLAKGSGEKSKVEASGDYSKYPEIDLDAWAVDASCLGNPGTMEYRGVEVKTGKEIFRVGPFPDATNNIGEYLALVHAMALMTQKGEYHNIYSDSKTAQSWVRNRRVKTQLKPTPRNAKVFELLARASVWVTTHSFPAKIMKWQTEKWGEIPADFGRK
ncbi:MAG: ribonuclease H family protein [Muribaculaceae bacterium]|nr:ribonuclease H family protein [Muribaculaceae bacterium]